MSAADSEASRTAEKKTESPPSNEPTGTVTQAIGTSNIWFSQRCTNNEYGQMSLYNYGNTVQYYGTVWAYQVKATGAALGQQAAPGRVVAVAAGFDTRTRAVRWRAVIPASAANVAAEGAPRIAELAHGRVYVVYDEWQGRWKVAAFDARSGARLWDAPLPGPVYITVSPSRVYFTFASPRADAPTIDAHVYALDAASGRPVLTSPPPRW